MLDLEWVTIPAGQFVYGVRPGQPPERFHQPAETIYLETFQISRYPVTCRQFAEWAASDHRWAIRATYAKERADFILRKERELAERLPDHPATMPWAMAWAFCEWIGARLPTSREWEKAARGPDGRTYPWGDEWDETRGHFYARSSHGARLRRLDFTTTPVNAFPGGASPYGVLDLMGNTLEYTLSTVVANDGYGHDTERAICRGSAAHYTRADRERLPECHRATHMASQPLAAGGADYIGLRPVRATWQLMALHGLGQF